MWVCRVLLDVQHTTVQRRLQLLQFRSRGSHSEQALRWESTRDPSVLTPQHNHGAKPALLLRKNQKKYNKRCLVGCSLTPRCCWIPHSKRQCGHLIYYQFNLTWFSFKLRNQSSAAAVSLTYLQGIDKDKLILFGLWRKTGKIIITH